MTREEFLKGWLFLTVQPWGKRYSGTDGAAMVQSELYYGKFKNTNPYVWQGCCEMLAEGNHWPPIDELKTTIKNNSPQPSRVCLPFYVCDDDNYFPRRVVMDWVHGKSPSLIQAAEYYLQSFMQSDKYNQQEKDRAVQLVAKLKGMTDAHHSAKG